MLKGSKRLSFFLFMMLQILIGTCAGFFVLFFLTMDSIPKGSSVGVIRVGGMSYDEARVHLKDYYDFYVKQSALEIQIEDRKVSIPLSDLDAGFDIEKTVQSIQAASNNALGALFAGENPVNSYKPVITFNTGKLSAYIEKLFNVYEKPPTAESYKIKDGTIIYQPCENGVEIDYNKLEEKISQHIHKADNSVLTINLHDSSLFKPVSIQAQSEKPYDTILSSSRINIGNNVASELRDTVDALTGKVIKNGESLLFTKLVDIQAFSGDAGGDTINRLASAVYQAFLPLEGIGIKNRRPSRIPVSYAEPGLEAVIEGDNGDLELVNETGKDLMLLGELKDNSIALYVVSNEEVSSGVIILQKKDIVPPAVVMNISQDLKKGETRVVSEGFEGFTVYVSRVIGNERTELYHDKYEPVSKVVETGVDTLMTGSK